MITSTHLEVGRRYINAKNRQSLTLLFIGHLPPDTTSQTSGPSSTPTWLGVEYDDPSYAKGHSGTYKGIQIFQARQENAGAFIKLKTGNELSGGKTFIQAINERYALDAGGMKSVVLGSSNAVVVEAPGMEEVSKRLKTLEKLRQIGLEDVLICGVGGSEAERADLAKRLRGVRMLNISRNLMTRWADVEEILSVVSGVTTLIMNDSRFKVESERLGKTISQIRELHIARSHLGWSNVSDIIDRFDGLEELHLSGNLSLANPPNDCGLRSETLKSLSLDECGIDSWALVEEATKTCTNLETLNISSNPIGPIVESSDKPSLERVKNLILLCTPIDSLASLAHLSSRISNLENLRFSLDPSRSTRQAIKLTGNDEEDRGLLLVLFPELVILNGNEIKAKEREEAERRFCSHHTSFDGPILQALLQRLTRKHGLQAPSSKAAQKTSLRSKMITLHVYPSNSSEAIILPVLPSAPISLVKRKIGKKVGIKPDDLRIWTVKRVQGEIVGKDEEVWGREKVMEIDEGEVGFWFDDGDGVIAELA